MLQNERIDIGHRVFAKDAVDMAVPGNYMTAVQARAVVPPQQLIGFLGAGREKAFIAFAMDKRNRNGQSIEMGKIRLITGGGHQMTCLRHERQMLKRAHVRDSKRFVERLVRQRIELRMLVQRGIHKRDAMTDGTVTALFRIHRVAAQRQIEEAILPVGVPVDISRQGLDAEGEQARQELADALEALDGAATRFVEQREEAAAKRAARAAARS